MKPREELANNVVMAGAGCMLVVAGVLMLLGAVVFILLLTIAL